MTGEESPAALIKRMRAEVKGLLEKDDRRGRDRFKRRAVLLAQRKEGMNVCGVSVSHFVLCESLYGLVRLS